jgi:hypothetical protein
VCNLLTFFKRLIKCKLNEFFGKINISFTRLLFGLIIVLSSVGISIMGISRKLIALNNTFKPISPAAVSASGFWSIGKILKSKKLLKI